MTVSRARLTIYFLWGGAFTVIVLLLELAPAFREGAISPADGHAALLKMGALFTPVLTAFASFWYGSGRQSAPTRITYQRWLPAIVTNVVLLLLIVGLLAFATLKPYNETSPSLTFDEWVSNIMQIGLLLSPIAVAPVAYLLGVESIQISS